MDVLTRHIEFRTQGNAESIDITPDIANALSSTGLNDGTVTVFVPGATGALTTVEFEPGLISDMKELWQRLVPEGECYHHDQTWHDGNGHSHLRATLLGPSITVPFCDASLTLGTWQQIIFIDFDVRTRTRRLVLQFIGK